MKKSNRSSVVIGWLLLLIAILLLTVVYPNQIIIKGAEVVSSSFFPKLCAYALIICAVWFLLDGYRHRNALDGSPSDEQQESAAESGGDVDTQLERGSWAVIWTMGICLLCIAAIHLFGLVITSFVFLTLSFKKSGMRNWRKPVLISAMVTAALYVIFRRLMLIVLPKGILMMQLINIIR